MRANKQVSTPDVFRADTGTASPQKTASKPNTTFLSNARRLCGPGVFFCAADAAPSHPQPRLDAVAVRHGSFPATVFL